MTKISIIAIFKNEAHIIHEWCLYYLNHLKIDHLYLINNESKDNYKNSLSKIDKKKYTLFNEKGKGIQLEVYRKYFKKIKQKYEWVFFCDLDEFLYFNNPNTNLKDFLDDHKPDIKVIQVQWKIFIPKNFTQPHSIIKSNNIYNINAGGAHFCKSIVRTNISPSKIQSVHTPSIKKKEKIKKYFVTDNIIQLNHYRYQSWQYMLGIKLSRGGGKNSGKKRWNQTSRSRDLWMNFDPKYNVIDNTLIKQSREIIKDVLKTRQTYPDITIYHDPIFKYIREYVFKNNLLPGKTVQSTLNYNKLICDKLEIVRNKYYAKK